MTTACNDEIIDAGVWFKDDEVSELRLRLHERDFDGKSIPMDISDASSITLELRSRDGTGAAFDQTFSVVSVPDAEVKLTNPGENWTPTAGRNKERFEGYPRVNKLGGSGWPKEVLHLTLRTAP